MLASYSLKLPAAVYSGEKAMDNLDTILADGSACVALFTEQVMLDLGLCDRALEIIKARGLDVKIKADLAVEPTYGQVQEVVDWYCASGADRILAIGGGSVMDAAKLVSVLAGSEYTVKDLLGDPSLARKQVRSTMVPTTAGTGAEATPNAIVAVPEDSLKVGIVNAAMIADEVILDDSMIKNLPRPIAAATGIDAMCHAIECFTSTKANPFSDTFALEAFDLILNNIEAACDDSEAVEAKRAMQLGSFYAGIAITAAGTTAVHALSYPLGGAFHVAHGVSNAILLMPVMRFNEPAIRERLALAYDRAMSGGARTAEEKAAAVIERMGSIVEHLNIPTKLYQLGVKGADVDELAEAGMSVKRLLANNMREVTLEDAKAIYAQIL